MIDTEIISMCLTDGNLFYRAGAGQGVGPQGASLQASLGAIAERAGDPRIGESFFDVFFEIEIVSVPGLFLYNQTPLLMSANIDCVPPATTYNGPPAACLALFNDPDPGQGVWIADAVGGEHTLYPPICTPPPSDMEAWWPGDGSTDDLVAVRNGTLVNGATFAPGKVAQAFSFDGNSWVEIADDPIWTLGTHDFTIDLWVQFNNLSGRDPFIGHDDGGGELNKWIFWYDQQGHDKLPGVPALRFHINSPHPSPVPFPHDTVVAPWNPTPGQWYHVAVTRDGDTYALFIDGAQAATDTSTFSIPDPGVPLTIGRAQGFRLNGFIDEVEIHSRALGAVEIHAVFSAGSAGKCKEEVPTCFQMDFETDDSSNYMPHGTKVDSEFDGGPNYPVTITSSVNTSGSNTAAVLNSTTGPAAQDPDLLVGSGNILILQTDANLSLCSPGIYCSHNDDEDGGTLSFAFNAPTTPDSIDLIDIDATDPVSSVVLTDVFGYMRTYTVPADWTGDVTQFEPGVGTLDLQTMAPQPGYGSTATATEDVGFDPDAVVQIDVNLGGSGGVDNLSWCPTIMPRAAAAIRNGSGVNPTSLTSASLPMLGGTWVANLDCTAQGSGVAAFVVRRSPTTRMTPSGEVLVKGVVLHSESRAHSGSVVQFTWDLPTDMALVGLDAHVQGWCSVTSSFVGKPFLVRRGVLSNAVDLILGF